MRTQHDIESVDEADEVVRPWRWAKWPRQRLALWVGIPLFVGLIVAGAATNTPKFVFGPSEQEIQDAHWEYEKVRVKRTQLLLGNFEHTSDIEADGKKANEKYEELSQVSLALERKYAKLWVQRGYKIRP
jgi:hypothetical protein